MKGIITVLTLVAFAFVGLTGFTFWDKKIKGSGIVKTEERSTPSFEGVEASRNVNVFIVQGERNGISIEADDNLLQYITTKVSGNTLEVSIEKDITIGQYKKLSVYVTMKNIVNLTVNSGGDINCTRLLQVKDVSLSASSGGDIDLELAGGKITVEVTSGADVRLKGSAGFLDVSVSSGSDFKGKEFVAKACKVSASSGGDVSVHVTDELSYSVSSGGDLSYWGDAQVTSAHSSSGGDVTHH